MRRSVNDELEVLRRQQELHPRRRSLDPSINDTSLYSWLWLSSTPKITKRQQQSNKMFQQNTKHKTQNTKFKIKNKKYKIQNTKYKIQNKRYKIHNT
jgi:hypothetical protein